MYIDYKKEVFSPFIAKMQYIYKCVVSIVTMSHETLYWRILQNSTPRPTGITFLI